LNSLDYPNSEETPQYWIHIAKRLSKHWQQRLQAEAEQAKELLTLSVTLPQNNLVLGEQTLNFEVSSTTLAQQLTLAIHSDDDKELFWQIDTAKFAILESGRVATLSLKVNIKQAGRYALRGTLTARDTSNQEIQQPFSVEILAAVQGKPYQVTNSPYTVGTRLSSDTTFVGRGDLIAWLNGLWNHPEKAAIVLIGQRRIGKSSLLLKLQRDYQHMPDAAQLIPLFLDIQDINSDYGFYNTLSREIANALNIHKPTLSKTETQEEFRDFLLDTAAVHLHSP